MLYYDTCLRCTLKGFERNSEINTHSKLRSNKLFSTSTIDINHNEFVLKMNPGFLTGFSGGEASFIVYIQKTNSTKICWSSRVAFEINLSGKDLSILKSIKSYFGVGGINKKICASRFALRASRFALRRNLCLFYKKTPRY